MKNLLRISLAAGFVCCFGLSVHAQRATREELMQRADNYRTEVFKAAETFFNRQLPDAERLRAIAPHPNLYDEKQIQQLKTTAVNAEEPATIRAAALNRLNQVIGADRQLMDVVVRWVSDPATPEPLRSEALNTVGILTFSNLEPTGAQNAFVTVLRTLTGDRDVEFRRFAFAKLVPIGDELAIQRLTQSLSGASAAAALPPPEAVFLLGQAPKVNYEPIYRVFQSPPDTATRLEAIRVLGPYDPARSGLTTIALNPGESVTMREAALGSLFAVEPEGFAKYAVPILRDGRAPESLHLMSIHMGTNVRQHVKRKGKSADEFDRLVRAIAEGKGLRNSPALQQLGQQYLFAVQPK